MPFFTVGTCYFSALGIKSLNLRFNLLDASLDGGHLFSLFCCLLPCCLQNLRRGLVSKPAAVQAFVQAVKLLLDLLQLLLQALLLLGEVHHAGQGQVGLHAVLHHQPHGLLLVGGGARELAHAQLLGVQAAQQGQRRRLRRELRAEHGVRHLHRGLHLAPLVDVVLGAGVAHGADQRLQRAVPAHRPRRHGQRRLARGFGPGRDHERVPRPGQLLPEHLGHVGHERVQQPQAGVEHVHQDAPGHGGLVGAHAGLGGLDVPVGVLVPEELVDLAARVAQVVRIQGGGDVVGQLVAQRDDVLLRQRQRGKLLGRHGAAHREGRPLLRREVLQVAQDEAPRVPQLVGEVPVGLHLLHAERHVLAGGDARDQRVPQGVRAVLLQRVDGVDHVALGLGHFLPRGVAHQAVHVDHLKGGLAGELDAHHHHAGHPEEQDVVPRLQALGGVEPLEVLALRVGPAHGGEGPQAGGEPGVQHVVVLPQRHTVNPQSRLGLRLRLLL
mmetsp:Transcript_498/g.824  ORF Transcript_498/g.824 Transcript_498/m.824 type:complete len:496 (+) Transcript_498:478-1965(+)